VRDAWNPPHDRLSQARIANLGGVEAGTASTANDPVEALAGFAESVDVLVLGSHA
jgi:hypothetical protein